MLGSVSSQSLESATVPEGCRQADWTEAASPKPSKSPSAYHDEGPPIAALESSQSSPLPTVPIGGEQTSMLLFGSPSPSWSASWYQVAVPVASSSMGESQSLPKPVRPSLAAGLRLAFESSQSSGL